ncbi:MAG: hypothetical protein MI725_10775, partial [Pirellulales bacterium]|nr:hypothetical protein [Pirellulales bacterium]
MNFSKYVLFASLFAVFWQIGFASKVAGEDDSEFRAVLELAGTGPNKLAQFTRGAEYRREDWRLLTRLLNRLRQYPDEQLQQWTSPAEPQCWYERPEAHLGKLCEISGVVDSVESLPFPQDLTAVEDLRVVYRCRFSSSLPALAGTLLTRQIPKLWKSAEIRSEPVRFRGILLRVFNNQEKSRPLLLTDRLAWFPDDGVPTGPLLLARHGMDVALLDEVVHRQPFVRPEISREAEAFYGCLLALRRIDHDELLAQCQETVAATAAKWRSSQADLREQHQQVKR